ncbi:MAG: hypothetical protein V3V78_00120, partial [Candidatus Woesearchaeota archaeon]
QQVAELKSRPVQQAPKVEPAPVEEKQENPANEPQQVAPGPAEEPQKVEEAQKEGESNPRTGNHNSEDVSIEKMFYYGNK